MDSYQVERMLEYLRDIAEALQRIAENLGSE